MSPRDDAKHEAKRAEARKRVDEWIDKPEHHKPKGSPEDEQTRDDALDDPALNEADQ